MYCEYLDTEWLRPDRDEVLPTHMLDPWRNDPMWADRVALLPRDVVRRTLQRRAVRHCETRDRDKVQLVRREIGKRGLERPLEMLTGRNGLVVLRDGHHRFLATEGIPHFKMIPCYFTATDNVAVDGAVSWLELWFEVAACNGRLPESGLTGLLAKQ